MLNPTALRFVATFRGTGDDYADAGLLAARLRSYGVQAYPRARGIVGVFEPNGKTYVDRRSGETRDSTSEKLFSVEELISKSRRAVEAIEVAHAAALLEDAARVAPTAKRRARKARK